MNNRPPGRACDRPCGKPCCSCLPCCLCCSGQHGAGGGGGVPAAGSPPEELETCWSLFFALMALGAGTLACVCRRAADCPCPDPARLKWPNAPEKSAYCTIL